LRPRRFRITIEGCGRLIAAEIAQARRSLVRPETAS
jgi:hypothetical protein